MFNVKDISVMEAGRIANDEAVVEEMFVQARWPNGMSCPKCGSMKASPVRSRKPQPYRCRERECLFYFSVKTKTIMHGSNLPLSIWFLAIYFLYTHPKGVASTVMAKHLGVTQKTAWHLAHRIRKGWENPDDEVFDGPVEVDETFVGGRKKNMPLRKRLKYRRGRWPDNKIIVMGMKDRKTKRVVVEAIPSRTALPMQQFVYKHIESGVTKVYTDAHGAYKTIPNHEFVNHKNWGSGGYVDGDVYTNGIEGFWTLIKRGYIGVYHYISKKHMHKYAVEFAERNNARLAGMDTLEVLRLIVGRMDGRSLTMEELRQSRIKPYEEFWQEAYGPVKMKFTWFNN